MARKLKSIKSASRKSPPSDRDYRSALLHIVRNFGVSLNNAIVEQWDKWSEDLAHTRAAPTQRSDVSAPREIRLVVDGVQAEFRIADKARGAAETQAKRIDKKNSVSTKAQIKQLRGVEPFDDSMTDLVDLFVEGNVGLIQNITQTQAEQIGQIVQANLVAGKTARETSQEIQERTGVAESRAKMLARDQTSKLNAQLSAARLGRAGISKYEWSTSRDERVRDSHAEKEGNIYEFADPPADTGNPGEDFNCRCVAIPVLDTLEE